MTTPPDEPAAGRPSPYPHPAFAPVARAPREPWVNPAKRAQLALLAVIVAAVLLFGGLAVGFVVGHHRGELNHVRFEGGYGPLKRPGAHPRGPQPNGGGPGPHRKTPLPARPRAPISPSGTATG